MKKLLAAAGVVVALGAGAFAISTILPAGAQTDSGGSTASSSAPDRPAGPGAHVKSVLDGLVANGTISQDQEDKIVSALEAAKPDVPNGRRGRGPRFGGQLLKQAADTAAGALGITVDELRTELRSGKSIADVAAEKGVSLDTVTKALTDAASARIDKALADGKIDQAKADAAKARLPQAIDRLEHANPPMRGGHPGGQPAPPAPDSSSSS